MLNSLFLIGSFGTTEMLLIAFVLILLFGANKIPQLFRGMGQGIREFKDASKPTDEPRYHDQTTATPPPTPTNPNDPLQPRR